MVEFRAMALRATAPVVADVRAAAPVAIPDLASYWVTMAAGEGYYIRLTDDNLFGVRAGRYGPTVDSGVYLMLRPLSAGEHTIHIFASDDATFTVDVTYELTVE